LKYLALGRVRQLALLAALHGLNALGSQRTVGLFTNRFQQKEFVSK
jgi:hypothetical protein